MAASDTDATPGCRRILANLIALTHPERASDFAHWFVLRFGSVGEVLAARPTDRMKVCAGASELEPTFQHVRATIDHILRGRLAARPVLAAEQVVLDYLRSNMAFEPVEHFRVLFLNAGNCLIADEIMAYGSVASVHAYPREILKRCLELGATAILLAHNHPSGKLAPSQADRKLTERIAQAAKCLGVVVHDHLVISRDGWTSFRKAGFL